MKTRSYSPLDRLIMNVDQALRTLAGKPLVSGRPNPADDWEESELGAAEVDESVRLMRVNHAGEVAAQGGFTRSPGSLSWKGCGRLFGNGSQYCG